MELSFIIVNSHNSSTLVDCLESIFTTPRGIEFEVIVVDNSPEDEDMKKVEGKFPQARFLKNAENLGFAVGNNQGFENSRGETIMFLNPDAVLIEEISLDMLNHLKAHPDIGILAPKVLDPNGTLQYSCRHFPTVWTGLFNRYSLLSRLFPHNRFSAHYLMTDFDHNQTREVDWVSGCCIMISRGKFLQVGKFDENYFLFNEDIDLCRLIKSFGYPIIYYPHAKVYHYITASDGKTAPQAIIKRHKGMSYYFKKHHSENVLTQIMVNAMISLRCLSQLFLNLFK